MKSFLCILFFFCFAFPLFAHHGKGGSISYTYLGVGSSANTSKYQVTVTHYINCQRESDEPGQVYLGIFDGATNTLINTKTIARTNEKDVTKTTFNPCINPVPSICFALFTYVTTIDLPDNTGGYTLAEQDCCRADGIVNITNPSSIGFTNVNSIPGVINGAVYRINSSPTLSIKDTAVICYSSSFTVDFGATDADGDSLSYSFCDATATGSSARQPNPPSSPPYATVPYTSGYSGTSPLGSGVTIDAKTGIISGIAPAATGPYAISVCIAEFRNGVQIGNTKKEVLVTVADCSLTAAALKLSYINCDDFTFSFQNESASTAVSSYSWNFGVAASSTDVSAQPTPTYTYADTGTYNLKLVVSNSAGCTDSATSVVRVYPGFTPAFTAAGSCYQSPFQFTDNTYVKYGSVSSWSWNFGDLSAAADTSSAKNPSYQYAAPGTATVVLTVASTKGCIDTVSKTVIINNKPAITLPFTDTLICSIDSLPLIVLSNGTSYSWSPLYNIMNPNTANPVVYPKDTTVYTVTVRDKGCVDSASITVNVLDFITVKFSGDTAICKTDSITLSPVSQALSYLWTEAPAVNSLSSYTTKYPRAAPSVTTTYYVTANLGHCQDSAKTKVFVSPYPAVNAGADTAVCFGNTAQLHATTNAPYFAWTPVSTLSNSTTLSPTAGPAATTDYILTVNDTTYCRKSVSDTVVVKVIQPVQVNAGNDTAIVIGQPLQLAATYDSLLNYTWTPVTYLNNSNIYNPVAVVNTPNTDSVTYLVTATTKEGCSGKDYITVKIYQTGPDIFVPTAFTPNGDGRNDILKPILAGISQFDFFRIYNRWGQLIYITNEAGKGWDGTLNGLQQSTGTFVFMAQGKDYLGKTIFKKGTVILIR